MKYPDHPLGVLSPARHHDGTAVALHEVSFMDVADEEARLNKVSYRRKIAMALADGIESYLDEAFSGAGVEMASEGLGDAIELAAAKVGLSSEDFLRGGVIERAGSPDFGMEGATPPMPGGSVSAGAGLGSISNGYMLGGDLGGTDDATLWALAQREARGVVGGMERGALGDAEGDEPSEFDPNVERVLGAMTANVGVNFGLLKGLFGRGPATANTPTPAHAAVRGSPSMTPAGGFDMNGFIAFIDGLNLNHFSPVEFLVLGGSHHGTGAGAGLNTYPPENLWVNIANTAKMLDEIRSRLGVRVFINSAYRSPAYNAAIGGAAHSQHLRFNAIDWRAERGTPDQWHAVAKIVESANLAAYGGWSKAYTGDNFVHIDTRSATVSLASG